jgi:hypothetical protein
LVEGPIEASVEFIFDEPTELVLLKDDDTDKSDLPE